MDYIIYNYDYFLIGLKNMPYSGDRGRNIKKFIASTDLKFQVHNETRFQIFGDDLCEVAAINVVSGIWNLINKGMVGIYCISCGHIHFSKLIKLINDTNKN